LTAPVPDLSLKFGLFHSQNKCGLISSIESP
jgi:hypothetical protein